MEASLAHENRVVLDLVQAALGLITREMRAISVRTEPGRIILYIAVHERSAQIQEDIDDLVFERATPPGTGRSLRPVRATRS
ncbi:hypothetical protein [Actinoplanes aureus]|uniref:Uncharacterized protein n=1 Tax=Actinoplanes aureus TaxID=2792083 RepID=A0A931G1W4_9ACTN|nr:hypothetical protein [Actinoplanes aureus]MBG0567087.1 hypothetical protein [Actinoplanes aureus]